MKEIHFLITLILVVIILIVVFIITLIGLLGASICLQDYIDINVNECYHYGDNMYLTVGIVFFIALIFMTAINIACY